MISHVPCPRQSDAGRIGPRFAWALRAYGAWGPAGADRWLPSGRRLERAQHTRREAAMPNMALARGEVGEQVRQQEMPAEIGVQVGDRLQDQLGVANGSLR